MKGKIHYVLILLLLSTIGVYAQGTEGFKPPDSLQGKSFEDLYGRYAKVMHDTTKSLIYLHSYLEKGRQEDEKINMARGYGLLSHYQVEDNIKLQYLDSSITVSKNLKNPYFPALSYSFKGGYYYQRLNFKEALHNFFLSLEAAKNNNSNFYVYAAKRNIALIKIELGKYDEALNGFRECLEYNYDDKIGIKDTIHYLFITSDISEAYSKKNMIDSSSYYAKEGIKISKMMSSDPYNFYYRFVFNEGVNHFYNKKYNAALDSINKALPFVSTQIDKNYVLNSFLYLGKIHDKMKEEDKAKFYYHKIDSVYQSSGNVSSQVREAYNALVQYYKNKKDTKNQLLYIEKLLQFDSILQNDYKELNDILVKQYDTPELLAEKELLVQAATSKNSTYSIYIIILIVSVLLFIGLFAYQYYRRSLYQKRFEILTQKDVPQEIKEKQHKEKEITAAEDIGISPAIVEEVLSKLQDFEDKKEFASAKITLTQLSSALGTNNKYLSKIINIYKEKSFSQYINDLRIDYIVERLQEDKKLRNYTIKAIARETGFNTAEVFSKAFYGKHGIYPSYFIKKLEKLEN